MFLRKVVLIEKQMFLQKKASVIKKTYKWESNGETMLISGISLYVMDLPRLYDTTPLNG